MKVKLQKPEIIILLKEELSELDKLCSVFDSGSEEVIGDMAKVISRIFQNTETSKSLLNQLKLSHISIYCGAEFYNPKSLINYLGLLNLKRKAEFGWNYYPKLNLEDLKLVSSENWWQNKKVIIDSLGVSYSRAKIIKSISIDDGELDQLDTSGWTIKDGKGIKINPIAATVRQIAFELLTSFKTIDLEKESKLHYKL
ncbi:hypothetical protein [Pedobacter aquatilis]|uniref:hypothetical protein n=1 Tax=Pedobacter aquatilis TaxID=351343 RepID=UPI00292E1D60|nr:hypothetical protein [Pedobacter aquatilis]